MCLSQKGFTDQAGAKALHGALYGRAKTRTTSPKNDYIMFNCFYFIYIH
jgi:hypothetical protein